MFIRDGSTSLRSTAAVLDTDLRDLLKKADQTVRKNLGSFVREFNRREWFVRVGKKCQSFQEYVTDHYTHEEQWGHGFVANGQAVPYFHPNRSFHDEIIWLNHNLYYDKSVSFTNKLLNSALVKFYGPSRTLDLATGQLGLAGSVKLSKRYVEFDRYAEDSKYALTILSNIEKAKLAKEQLWGTTELRTSLMGAAAQYAQNNPSMIDKSESYGARTKKMRSSDMVHWIASMKEDLVDFYSTKPDMKKSFEKLTSYKGIGNYYGYHFSSNLCRMPGIGAPSLVEAPATLPDWRKLRSEIDVEHGNLDENADYVVAGPGACATLARLWPGVPINPKTTMKMILAIRDHQHEFFGIDTSSDLCYFKEATELGQFTTFGVEIACCQYNVFERLSTDLRAALNRAAAPISKEVSATTAQASLTNFFN